MYIPPFESLLQALNISRSALDERGSITLPLPVFKLLLKAALEAAGFDEEDYLQENPDVRRAVRDGNIESGFAHYLEFGYLEGRRSGAADVDTRWYLKTYPDIAAAAKNGKADYAIQHFYDAGAAEGRSPNAESENAAIAWRRAFQSQI